MLNNVIRILLFVKGFKDVYTYTSTFIYAEDPSERMTVFSIFESVEGKRFWGLGTKREGGTCCSLLTIYYNAPANVAQSNW